MDVTCDTETGDGSKGSGDLYVIRFDGSFPYILAGEFVCTLSKLLPIKNSPFFCCCESGVSDISRESILYDPRGRESPLVKKLVFCTCQLALSYHEGSN